MHAEISVGVSAIWVVADEMKPRATEIACENFFSSVSDLCHGAWGEGHTALRYEAIEANIATLTEAWLVSAQDRWWATVFRSGDG